MIQPVKAIIVDLLFIVTSVAACIGTWIVLSPETFWQRFVTVLVWIFIVGAMANSTATNAVGGERKK